MFRIALALALVAGPAAAQTMDCRGMEGGRMVCTTSWTALANQLNDRAAERAEVQAPSGPPAPFVTPQQRKLVTAVAKAVVAGRCEKARALAIDGGDIDLATEAMVRCEALKSEKAKSGS